MNRLLRLLGYRDRTYRGADFNMRIEPIFREEIRVIYKTSEKTWNFGGTHIANRGRGIEVVMPPEIDSSKAHAIALQLAEALTAMGYGYVISHALEIETVSQCEKDNAISELREMGYEVEVLADGKIRQTRIPGSPKLPLEELKKQTPRMMKLIEAVQGKRRGHVTLAKSEEF